MKPPQSLPSSDGHSRLSTLLAGVLASSFLAAHAQTIIPPSYAYPLGSGDATKPGFVGKMHVARANQSFNASIGRANAQLRDELTDNTLTPPAPYLNLVQTPDHLCGPERPPRWRPLQFRHRPYGRTLSGPPRLDG
jgi:hypothetical protein